MPTPLSSIRLNWIVPVNPLMPVVLWLMSLASDRLVPPIVPLPVTPTVIVADVLVLHQTGEVHAGAVVADDIHARAGDEAEAVDGVVAQSPRRRSCC